MSCALWYSGDVEPYLEDLMPVLEWVADLPLAAAKQQSSTNALDVEELRQRSGSLVYLYHQQYPDF